MNQVEEILRKTVVEENELNKTLVNTLNLDEKEIQELCEWTNLSIIGKHKKLYNKICNKFKELYKNASLPENYDKRKNLLEEADFALNSLSKNFAYCYWKTHKSNALAKVKKCIEEQYTDSGFSLWNYVVYHEIMPAIGDALHNEIKEAGSAAFTELYQKYGNSIRMYGNISGNGDMNNVCEFAIPRRINRFIKSYRHPFEQSFSKPTRIVIDSIKNTFEATYLRERYSAFYLFAISSDEKIRRRNLRMSGGKNLSEKQIDFIDWNEYSYKGAELYKRFIKTESVDSPERYDNKDGKFSSIEIEFIKKIEGVDVTIKDDVRRIAYENNMHQFILQDVGASIENADVFISNNHNDTTKNMALRWEIVRNISLIMHPGLLMPTPIERCMQVAFCAKANSGCVSRQVGAVVTDDEYNILSMGWNDVPCGDVSCSKKNLIDIYNQQDKNAYTDYEIHNEDFKHRIKNARSNLGNDIGQLLCGLPLRYCFKDIHSDTRNPMRSRSMHAEEKALANVHSDAYNGYLFTTSSPCEMCSKNAKNHRIKKIYYIEPYPGISEEQYSGTGDRENRAEHILYTGAVGRAYTQMYTQIMPYKDILQMLGVRYK